ncbi:MAG TPA: hypothetical protein VKL22_06155 [Actinomycetota bacterium]|nr:hypothetical protein [Actinomycetota bacterium]
MNWTKWQIALLFIAVAVFAVEAYLVWGNLAAPAIAAATATMAAVVVGLNVSKSGEVVAGMALAAVACGIAVAIHAASVPPQTITVTPLQVVQLNPDELATFTASDVAGHTHLQVAFKVEDFNRAQPTCMPQTRLDVSAGPSTDALRQVSLGANDSVDIPLPSSSGKFYINVYIRNTDHQTTCPVDLTIRVR